MAAAGAARDQLAQLPGLSLLQDGSCGCQESVLGFDPCRLVLNVASLGVSGFAAAAWLEEQHGIVPELATNKVGPVFGGRLIKSSHFCISGREAVQGWVCMLLW